MEPTLFAERTNSSDGTALELAWKRLLELGPVQACEGSLASFDGNSREYSLDVLGAPHRVALESRKVLGPDGKEVPPPFPILILHYLAATAPLPLTGELISFRELEGGEVYYAAYEGRAIRPLREKFGPDPPLLLRAGAALHARPFRLGHASLEVPLFPRVPVYVVVWAGDDEVPSSANVLFDSTIRQQMHTEDVAVSASLVASKLRKAA
jgi:hypothetical protein